MKTGTRGAPWVTLDPKPPKVDNVERYWIDPPPEPSARLVYWLAQIDKGWRPNGRRRIEDGYTQADLYGVYIWELRNVLWPRLNEEFRAPS